MTTLSTLHYPRGCTISLKCGCLIDEDVDAIVNITQPNLQLDCGTLSTNVLKHAGPKIQQECSENFKGGIEYGQFAKTSGGRLKCKTIYHGAVSNWDNGKSQKCFDKLLQSILKSASADNWHSLALPAIGTGKLKFPPLVVAKSMLKVIHDTLAGLGGNLSDIRIILHPNDTDNIKFFSETFSQRKQQDNQDYPQTSKKPRIAVKPRTSNDFQTFSLQNYQLSPPMSKRRIMDDNETDSESDNEGPYPKPQTIKQKPIKMIDDSDTDSESVGWVPFQKPQKIKQKPLKMISVSGSDSDSDDEGLTAAVSQARLNSPFKGSVSLPSPKPTQKMKSKRGKQSLFGPLHMAAPGNGDNITIGSFNTNENVNVVLKKGCITKEKGQVVVNMVGQKLDLKEGAISKAILRVGGNSIQKEFSKACQQGIQCGDFIPTSAGILPFELIYHGTIHPWKTSEKELKDFVTKILMAAHQKFSGGTTVVFPTIGTGLMFKYPREVVSKVMLDAISSFSQSNPGSNIKSVVIVVFHEDQETAKTFLEMLPAQSKSNVQSARPQMSRSALFQNVLSDEDENMTFPDLPVSIPDQIQANTHNIIIGSSNTKENISIVVKKGCITKEKGHVVVNMVGQKLDLKEGAISKALLRVGGNSIQKDFSKTCQQGIQCGNFVQTSGGNLPCQLIFHGRIHPWQKGRNEDLKVLVTNILKTAHRKFSSGATIIFPTIGTGLMFEYPREVVAKVMLDAISSFSQSNPGSNINIVIVVYHEDQATSKVFLEMLPTMQKLSQLSRYPSLVDSESEEEQTMLFQSSSVGMPHQKPGNFLNQLFQISSASLPEQKPGNTSNITIGSFSTKENIRVVVKKGCITKEKGHVVVNMVGQKLDLKEGAISKALLRIGGNRIEMEFRKACSAGIQYGDFVQTTGGHSPFQLIFHGTIHPWKKGQEEELKAFVIKNLMTAQRQFSGGVTVVFPTIGTGLMLEYPREIVAKVMLDAITSFSQSYPGSNIKSVVIVVFHGDQATSKAFLEMLPSSSSAQVQQTSSHIVSSPSSQDGRSGENKNMAPAGKLYQGQGGIPGNWSPMNGDSQYALVELDRMNSEYDEVLAKFMSTARVDYVEKIERVQSLQLHQMYELRKTQISDKNKNNSKYPTERILYHGTSQDVTEEICRAGFNRSYTGKNGTALGKGVYFARDASYSTSMSYSPPDLQGRRYIFQCLVLTGMYAQGKQNLREPPKRPDGRGRYDSVVDKPLSPSVFAVFHDAQVYPQYLITFI